MDQAGEVVIEHHGVPVRPPMFSDWPLDASIETIVTLDDVGGGTKVTVAHRVLPPAAASHPAAKHWSPMCAGTSARRAMTGP